MPSKNDGTETSQRLGPAWIEDQYSRMNKLYEDGDLMHNRLLHEEILEDWKWNRPEMYQRLKKAGLHHKLAFVLQEKMWQEEESLSSAGMPPGDAKAQAMAEWLMLGPEPETEESEAEEQDESLAHELAESAEA